MSLHLRGVAISLVLLGLLVGLNVWADRPPAPQGLDAPADQFSAGRAFAVLSGLLAEGVPHPVGSPANARVRDRILAAFKALGYEAEVERSTVGPTHWTVENIVTRLAGQEAGPAVMLVAHYDSVRAGPGASDDGSGVAIVLEVARILKAGPPPRHPVVFLLTDGEEAGLWGAQAFVEKHPWAKQIGVVVNVEARGTSGRSLMFETSEGNAQLIAAYAAAVARPDTSSLYFEIYRRMPNDTDLSIFKRAGLAGMNFAFIGSKQNYHTARDDLAHLDQGSLQHQGDNALAMVRRLAATDLSHSPPGNAVYIDFLGLAVIRWPQRWGLPLAVMTSLVLALLLFGLVRSRAMSLWELACGLTVCPTLVLAAELAGAGGKWLALHTAAASHGWLAQPACARAALWAEVVLVVVGLTALCGRWPGFWGLWAGLWTWWSIATLVVSALLPGAACFFLIPLATMAVVGAAVRLGGLQNRWSVNRAAVAVAALVVGLFWIKAALGLEEALGLGFTAGVTVPLAVVLAAMAPVWMAPRPQQRLADNEPR